MEKPRPTLKRTVTSGKSDLNNRGIHVPLITVAQGVIPENKKIEDLIDFVDLFPNFCHLAKIEILKKANPDGISFVEPLLGTGLDQREWITEGINDNFYVFDGQWRMYHKNDSLVDCRELPWEKPADMTLVKQRLQRHYFYQF